MDPQNNPKSPLALYIHIPFCETKCPYCDFNTYAGIEALVPSYVPALRKEIEIWGEHLDRPPIQTVFFGGGTPSYLPSGRIASVLDTIRSAMDLASDAEVTLESNPGDFAAAKLAEYLDAGINRLSIGVQSLDDKLLELLGRRHSADDAVRAYRMASEAGFDNVSIDLMYGLPQQTLEQWEHTLDGAAELSPAHLSLYCLTLEEGTPMESSVRTGRLPDPDQDLAADMYQMAREKMGRLAYRHYEISNWARPGLESRHNLTYWHNQPFLGVGPGAHSYLHGLRFANLASPKEYSRRLNEGSGDPKKTRYLDGLDGRALKSTPVVDKVESIDRRLEMAETLMLGLRLEEGIEIEGFAARFDARPADVYGEEIDDLRSLGLLETANGYLRLTDRGRPLGNEVFSRFF